MITNFAIGGSGGGSGSIDYVKLNEPIHGNGLELNIGREGVEDIPFGDILPKRFKIRVNEIQDGWISIAGNFDGMRGNIRFEIHPDWDVYRVWSLDNTYWKDGIIYRLFKNNELVHVGSGGWETFDIPVTDNLEDYEFELGEIERQGVRGIYVETEDNHSFDFYHITTLINATLVSNETRKDLASKEDVNNLKERTLFKDNVKLINGQSIVGQGEIQIKEGIDYVKFNEPVVKKQGLEINIKGGEEITETGRNYYTNTEFKFKWLGDYDGDRGIRLYWYNASLDYLHINPADDGGFDLNCLVDEPCLKIWNNNNELVKTLDKVGDTFHINEGEEINYHFTYIGEHEVWFVYADIRFTVVTISPLEELNAELVNGLSKYELALKDDFKTINGESIVGQGDIEIQGGVDFVKLNEPLYGNGLKLEVNGGGQQEIGYLQEIPSKEYFRCKLRDNFEVGKVFYLSINDIENAFKFECIEQDDIITVRISRVGGYPWSELQIIKGDSLVAVLQNNGEYYDISPFELTFNSTRFKCIGASLYPHDGYENFIVTSALPETFKATLVSNVGSYRELALKLDVDNLNNKIGNVDSLLQEILGDK